MKWIVRGNPNPILLMDHFFAVLESYHPLTPAFKEALHQHLEEVALPKNHLLLEPGRVASHAYFLISGHVMTYRYHREEKFIERFWHPNDIVFGADSFFDQIPAEEFMELLTPCTLLHIGYSNVRHLLDTFPEADVIYRKILSSHYHCCRKRLEDHLFLTAAQRYEQLHDRFAIVEQLLPQEQIAAYLGIAPQSLSRIKKQLRGQTV